MVPKDFSFCQYSLHWDNKWTPRKTEAHFEIYFSIKNSQNLVDQKFYTELNVLLN